MTRTAIALFAAFALGACATLRNDKTICPEYRNLRCMTAPECSMDAKRGCQVCSCSPATVGPDRAPPSGLPPDRQPGQ